MTFHSSQAARFLQEYNSSSALPFPFEFCVSSLLCAIHQSTQIQATPHFSFLWWPWSSSSGQSITPRGMQWDVPLQWCREAQPASVLYNFSLLFVISLLLFLSHLKTKWNKTRQSKNPRIRITWNELRFVIVLTGKLHTDTSNNLLIHITISYTITSLSSFFSAWLPSHPHPILYPWKEAKRASLCFSFVFIFWASIWVPA